MTPQQSRLKTFHPMGPSGAFEPLAIAVALETAGASIIDTQCLGALGPVRKRLAKTDPSRGFLMDFAAA
ncbi:hypothetical protein [Phaeobacter gallaeciensis]|uniref:hypothetical protein n=1 Tax=Phaeobacter gallaeciensis TaxID=60890 RepID=UPI00237F2A6A|nr:hypothetical protein [Phaeobacter gallaeciensis]MDE4098415.1 hypothetical protein [Phaeobacter gallaeciensis]MDE4107225.1 hypothetical protein [Phaeobacter gallaeciensis]MDE4111823.1 hypothetical protein [Phaeobacter gallaeciensis]MDE4116150.1 hypothetical protein [Phaeobacter gallaeciensis]MDE4120621.1 hypothetical protein [Phaeobacter gallaeciensis]